MDVRESINKWKNLRDEYICLRKKNEEKKLTTTKRWGPGRKTIAAFYFFKLVGVAYETLGHHHTVINS